MITLDALLVFLGAAALPAIYVLIISRWIEPEFRKTSLDTTAPKVVVKEAAVMRTAA